MRLQFVRLAAQARTELALAAKVTAAREVA